MKDKILIGLLNLMPKKSLSRLVGALAKSNFSRAFIPFYANYFKIDVSQAEKPLKEYSSLVEFFIRRLKPGLREIDTDDKSIVSPVDGKVSEFGRITEGKLIQAKGMNYSVENLLGGNKEKAARYKNGLFMTIYLSPRDYHRIHTPLAGNASEYVYVPGTLFPVNALGVRAVHGLFAKNERLITYLKTQAGEVALIKVGATIVGSVKVGYDKTAGTNLKGGKITHKTFMETYFEKGAELGYFEFGSTVILLFEPGKIQFKDFKAGDVVRMGEAIGRIS